MRLQCTEVFENNWEAIHQLDSNGERKYRYIINEGSSRSSKTYSLIDCIDLYARANQNKRITAWRETKKDCKDTLFNDFLKHLRETKRFSQRSFNKTESYYTYSNGSIIEARGTDDESVFGLTQSVAWLNEPYSISKDIFDQIDQRTSDYILIDWNPKQNHWIDELKKNPRTLVVHSTYKNNPFCPEESRIKLDSYEPLPPHLKYLINEPLEKVPKENIQQWTNEINGTANLYKWQVYGLGIKGEVEGKVFNDYEIIEDLPKEATLYGYGLDFGYTNDPTAMIALYEYNGKPLLHEIIYSTGLKITPLTELMIEKGVKKTDLIIADKSAPLMIDEIFDKGFGSIYAATKGVGTIVFGIDLMKDKGFVVTAQSTNLINELDEYKNKKDKFGKYINEPEVNQMDHAIDSARYIFTDKYTQKKFIWK